MRSQYFGSVIGVELNGNTYCELILHLAAKGWFVSAIGCGSSMVVYQSTQNQHSAFRRAWKQKASAVIGTPRILTCGRGVSLGRSTMRNVMVVIIRTALRLNIRVTRALV